MINYNDLLEKAKEVSKSAYCPYSKFAVGACVLYESGNFYIGCNVENSSYGLSLCAERNAFSTAIANGEKTSPVAIAIVSPNKKLCQPCGACRQWLCEFQKRDCDIDVILEDENGQPKVFKSSELLPHGFDLIK
ncbi:cytidine deaminase [bacterium]|nr:cytidine deaminase [bacterium]